MATSLSFWSCLSFKLSQTNLFDNRIKRRKILLRIYQPIAWKQEIYIHPFYFPIRKILKENSQKPKWTKQNVVRRFWNEIAFKLRTTHIQTQTLFPPSNNESDKILFPAYCSHFNWTSCIWQEKNIDFKGNFLFTLESKTNNCAWKSKNST